MTTTPATFDEADFHEAQRKRLNSRRIVRGRLEGAFANALRTALRRHFPDLIAVQQEPGQEFAPDELAACFAEAGVEDVEKLFDALTKATAASRPSTDADRDWLVELVVYASLRALDRRFWMQVKVEKAGDGLGAVHLVPAASPLVAAIGVAGWNGFLLQVGTDGRVGNIISLSDEGLAGDLVDAILGKLYDEYCEDKGGRRVNTELPLSKEDPKYDLRIGMLRNHFAQARLDGRIAAPYLKLTNLDPDQLLSVTKAVADVIDNVVLAPARETDANPLLDAARITLGQLEDKIDMVLTQLSALARRAHAANASDARDDTRDSVVREPAARPKTYDWDVFVSHSSSDKAVFVDALVKALKDQHQRVWYDKEQIRPGQSITKRIGDGLARSKAVVVVFSPSFLKKGWTMAEVEAAFNAGVRDDTGRVLPVLLDLTIRDLAERQPLFASLLCLDAADGADSIAQDIVDAVRSLP